MPVGATILPCCCDAEAGNCGGLSHANAPSTISVSGGFVSVLRRVREPSAGSPDVHFRTTVTYTRSFQGILNKTSSSTWNCSLTCALYSGRVETEWSISQTAEQCGDAFDGSQPWLNCSSHIESASHSYGECPTGGFPSNFLNANACLPTMTLYCSKTGTGTNSIGTCPASLCEPDQCIVPFPYLVAHFSTVCGAAQQCATNSGIGVQYPYRPTFPWPGLAVPWYRNGDFEYLLPTGFGSPSTCAFQPAVASWVKGGGSVSGSYTPARNNFSGTQEVSWLPSNPSTVPCEPPVSPTCDLFQFDKVCQLPDRSLVYVSAATLESFLEVT
jgi:hypothetical protein